VNELLRDLKRYVDFPNNKWVNFATLIFISIGHIYSMIFSKVKQGFP